MAEQAIILIPDISGFTDFTGATEIDHAAHIITELLELIVASNETDFTLAEIEGDAVLFYRKGEPLRREQLIDQCLRMFANFHQRLMVIERDTVCQCGACQTASNLTLKFIVHFGYIKEIKVAQFVKATGIDMIVAHRLLKNDVGAHEYILITEPCCAAVGQDHANPEFKWAKSSQAYDTIGNVAYEFATLTDYRAQIPEPPAPPRFVVEKGDDNLEIVIDAPIKAVYQTLVNVDKRPEWLDGVDTIDREMTSERINMRHNCVFHGLKLINTAVFCDFSEQRARYSEKVEIPEIGLMLQAHYEMKTGRRGQHAAELQRQLDGRKPAGRQEAGHDGWAGGELRTVQEGLRDQSRLAGSPLSLRESEFSPVLDDLASEKSRELMGILPQLGCADGIRACDQPEDREAT